ncbi:RagB/SusD family nutrient uptake outer membrane protein [Hyunsoonleella pacifica]|uniref:RagB/SusD family nutrient uptake outer membrane protein n=1 Tax=Hyunsoonleella pacifica TaxID=1080224 RepID=A0A4Q9FNL1_9FLAO|nr:RagB/SusD family nutrient uptake outer membrane protein [Hyunsoonleella pacifica]TBN16275.1 RagB/SusD family nutrient uptake outer membrane protein [Hyunsoonleella pacifica]GGD20807.1 membrane protein [Hyunsoonleella pacifica]
MENINNTKIWKLPLSMIIIVLFLINLNSCSEEFVDEPKDNSGVTGNIIFSNRDNIQVFINGILSNYKGQYRANPDEGGIYSMYFARAVKGNDIIQAFTFYTFDYGHENREPNFRRTDFTWDFNYENVNFANTLIKGVQENEVLSDNDKKEFIAKGKFFRGFHLFELLLEFCPNYNNDRDLERIPFYTEQTTLETVNGNPPAPMREIYNQVIQDLEDAVADLPDTRLGKSFINKAVAQAVLTRVLSVTQDDWGRMSDVARAAYGGDADSAVQSANWGNGFSDMTDQEWLWALFQNGTDETNFFWGHAAPMMDHLTLSYSATYFDPEFVNEFSATDSRNLFFDIYGVSDTEPWREFVSTKYAFTFASDIPLIRKSEMVLFDAEAQYQLGNTTGAQDLLFALQSARDPNAVKTTSTGQALLDEILLERKKEFYGEFGPQWFDAKRYNLPIIRNDIHRISIDVPADSNLFFLKIPEDEIDLNPNYAGFNNE